MHFISVPNGQHSSIRRRTKLAFYIILKQTSPIDCKITLRKQYVIFQNMYNDALFINVFRFVQRGCLQFGRGRINLGIRWAESVWICWAENTLHSYCRPSNMAKTFTFFLSSMHGMLKPAFI